MVEPKMIHQKYIGFAKLFMNLGKNSYGFMVGCSEPQSFQDVWYDGVLLSMDECPYLQCLCTLMPRLPDS